jgi:DNA-binding NtrC family response regulator
MPELHPVPRRRNRLELFPIVSGEEQTTQVDDSSEKSKPHFRPETTYLALVIVWSHSEPWRVGESILLPRQSAPYQLLFGRAETRDGDPAPRARLIQQTPGDNQTTGPIEGSRISRQQLLITIFPDKAPILRNLGRCPVLLDGQRFESTELTVGARLTFHRELLFLCVERPLRMPRLRYFSDNHRLRFGHADHFGIVGESPAIWELRDSIAFAAKQSLHVLIAGASGTGKELTAKAIHQLSERARKTWVARNAATFPAGLIDAELFGNIGDYPNPGMKERAGLVGEADRSTLFLDEIGELPEAMQTHLLRVLDAQGEYQRLGEGHTRRSDFRLLGATNRSYELLRADFLARFKLRIALPSLEQRREDIPLIVRHLMMHHSKQDPELGRRFCSQLPDQSGYEPRLSWELMHELLVHPFTTHVREIDLILWSSIGQSPGDTLELTPATQALLHAHRSTVQASSPTHPVAPGDLSEQQIREALERNKGVIDRTWQELGLKNRFALMRLVKKYNLKLYKVQMDLVANCFL